MVRLIANSWNKVILAYNGNGIETISEYEDMWHVVFASMIGVCEDGGGVADLLLLHGDFTDSVLEDKFREACEEHLELDRHALVDKHRLKDGVFYVFDDVNNTTLREVESSAGPPIDPINSDYVDDTSPYGPEYSPAFVGAGEEGL